jgi:hypothetical protein
MRILRWIACFPAAIGSSFFAWALAAEFLTYGHYGPSLLIKIGGLAPLVLNTAIPAVAFVLAGVAVAPSKGRRVGLLFFGLALLFSAGGVELLTFQSDAVFWLSASLGTVLGALTGLAVALQFQSWRKKRSDRESHVSQ